MTLVHARDEGAAAATLEAVKRLERIVRCDTRRLDGRLMFADTMLAGDDPDQSELDAAKAELREARNALQQICRLAWEFLDGLTNGVGLEEAAAKALKSAGEPRQPESLTDDERRDLLAAMAEVTGPNGPSLKVTCEASEGDSVGEPT